MCNNCGSDKTTKSYAGDKICAGCGTGVTSPKYTGQRPIDTCSQCGTPIYTAELFRGPVCPKCGHWC